MKRFLPVYGGRDLDARREVRAQVGAALGRGVPPDAVVEVVARAVDAQWNVLAGSELGGEAHPVCRAGCSHCCHQLVEATAAEVVSLARAVAAHPEAERLRASITRAAEAARGLEGAAYFRARIRCALLDDHGRCAVHASRPLACRRAHSTSEASCRDALGDPDAAASVPVSPSYAVNLAALVIGALEGLVRAGHPPHQHELQAALELTLGLGPEDVAAQVARGEDPLAPARRRHADEVAVVLGLPPEPSMD